MLKRKLAGRIHVVASYNLDPLFNQSMSQPSCATKQIYRIKINILFRRS